MQLRKAANNALLFRHYYSDDKITIITDRLHEENEKAKEIDKSMEQEISNKRKQEEIDNNPKRIKLDAITQDQEKNHENSPKDAQEPANFENNLIKHKESPGNKQEQIGDIKPDETTNRSQEKEEPQNETQNTENKDEKENQVTGSIIADEECGICGETGNLLCCDGPCNRVFHLSCLGFSNEPTDSTWYCIDCEKLVEDELYKAEPSPEKNKFQEILDSVLNLKDKKGRSRSDLFVFLPAKQIYPDYYSVIKNPISLYMIEKKNYQNPKQFRDDFYILFNNAKIYNLPNSQVARDAQSLQVCFEEEFIKKFGSELLDNLQDFEDFELTDDFEEKPKRRSYRSKSTKKRSELEPLKRSTRSNRKFYDEDEDEEFLVESEDRRRSLRKSNKQSSQLQTSSLQRKVRLSEPFLTCRNILEEIMDSDDSSPFNSPVDINLQDYYKIVKNPLDLGTVLKKLNSKDYNSTDEFVDDVRLVFDNCLLYNIPTSQIGLVAQRLWSFFKRQCRKYLIPVGDAKANLANRKMKKEDLSLLPEELKLKSDLEIHLFCKNYDCLRDMCLSNEQIFYSSGKLIELRKQLQKYHENDSRILIFSQFTQILNILEEFLSGLGFKFLRLDGSTPVLERQMLIDEFNNNKDIYVFLLSTRAGGLGINLTSADICVFHDIDWNPEMDRQAEARIHRIGQVKPVEVIKLLTKNTVDEYIFKMAQNKKQRNDLVMGEGQDKGTSGLITEEKLSIGQVLASIFTKEEKF